MKKSNIKKDEIILWGVAVLLLSVAIIRFVFAQDRGVPKPPTPVYTPPVYNMSNNSNLGTNATYDTGTTVVPPPVVAAKATVSLTDAENSLQQTICDTLPTTASSLPTGMLNVTVLLPSNFDAQVDRLGDTVTFGTITTNIMTTYKNNKYFSL